jgi:hypothetical protein
MYRSAPISAFVVAITIGVTIDAGEPAVPSPAPFLRLAIVDTSGSMSGARLDVARNELLRLARQLPPSPSHPFVVIPFNSKVRDVQTFTDLPPMETFLTGLAATGGTNIAAGLARATDQLSRYPDTPNVCILLYTDGQDGSRDQIAAQEAKLDALFADRQTRGLGQTVVFCKRWQGSGAQLVQRLADRGHARIIDAAELNLVPVTLIPHVAVEHVQWLDGGLSTLEVHLNASIRARGQDSAYRGNPLLLECVTPEADGDVRVPITPGTPPTPFTIRLPVSPKTAIAGGRLEVHFKLAEPTPTHSPDTLLLPMLTLDRITVPVDIPVTKFRSLISASLEQTGLGKWADPLQLKPVFPLRLTLNVSTVDDSAWACPVPFRLTPQAGTQLLDGQDTVLLRGPGKYELTFSITAAPASIAPQTGLPEFQVAFRVHPESVPLNVQFEPAQVDFDETFAAPPPVVTNITARISALSQPHWTDLRHAIATFDADLAVSVNGPISPGTKLAIRCPPPVRDVQITPAVLRQGSQTVRLRLLAVIPPAPARKELVFRILPPVQKGAVRLQADGPFSCTLAGPPAVQLALSDGNGVRQCFRTIHRDTTHPARLSVLPVLIGIDDQTAADGLGGSIRSSGTVAASTLTPLPLYSRANIHLTLPPQTKRSFFRDTRIHGEISVLPYPESPALVGSTHSIQATLEAPFKRLLCHLALATCSLLALFLIVRMFLRLRTPSED